ncbi:hypothetical protein L7P61_18245 [Aeromonas veronii bv. sobria]|uniref:hypothetical protein n=1 Tax=Aeromonas veronii TaxID=654 RepID=UPI001068864F|nr:hypothetical protein [Aeromonas veronii]
MFKDLFKSAEEKRSEELSEKAKQFIYSAANATGSYFGAAEDYICEIVALPKIIMNEDNKAPREIMECVSHIDENLAGIHYYLSSNSLQYCYEVISNADYCNSIDSGVSVEHSRVFKGAVITFRAVYRDFSDNLQVAAASLKLANDLAQAKALEMPESETLRFIADCLSVFRSGDPTDFLLYCRNAFNHREGIS